METSPLVSVLILNFRNAKRIGQCVENLKKQTVYDQMEIIVVDNFSNDDSVGIIRNTVGDDPKVRVVETAANLGFGSGYERGVQYARGKYLLFNNPDKQLQSDGIEKLITKMEEDEHIGIIGPKLVHEDGSVRTSPRNNPSPSDLLIKRTFLRRIFPQKLDAFLQLSKDPSEERDTDWVCGGCFMIKNEFFLELGGFDDQFFLFFEDTDICRKCKKAGKRVVYAGGVEASDRKSRLSEMNLFSLLLTKIGRAHIISALKYFRKWGI